MPLLERPDGVALHWDARGQGRAVVLACDFFNPPTLYEKLLADLALDHRLLSFDYRGAGESTRAGPYAIDSDAADLAAVCEQADGAVVVIGMGYGCLCAVQLAAERPELAAAVVGWGNPLGRAASRETGALGGSGPVLVALLEMLETDFRSAIRQVVAAGNPELGDEWARRRVDETVAYVEHEAAAGRLRAYVATALLESCRGLGSRLTLLFGPSNPWFTPEVAEQSRALLPEATVEVLPGAAVSRPHLTAAMVREAAFRIPA